MEVYLNKQEIWHFFILLVTENFSNLFHISYLEFNNCTTSFLPLSSYKYSFIKLQIQKTDILKFSNYHLLWGMVNKNILANCMGWGQRGETFLFVSVRFL